MRQIPQFGEFVSSAKTGEKCSFEFPHEGVTFVSSGGKLHAEVKCNLDALLCIHGGDLRALSSVILASEQYSFKSDAQRFPTFLEVYYGKKKPTEVDLHNISPATAEHLRNSNTTVKELVERGIDESESKFEFCLWLKDHADYHKETIDELLCAVDVGTSMSIVAAHRLGALDDSNADIEAVYTEDYVAANAASFGLFV